MKNTHPFRNHPGIYLRSFSKERFFYWDLLETVMSKVLWLETQQKKGCWLWRSWRPAVYGRGHPGSATRHGMTFWGPFPTKGLGRGFWGCWSPGTPPTGGGKGMRGDLSLPEQPALLLPQSQGQVLLAHCRQPSGEQPPGVLCGFKTL